VLRQPITSSGEWDHATRVAGLLEQLNGAGEVVIDPGFDDELAAALFTQPRYAEDLRYAYSVELVDRASQEPGAEGIPVPGLGIRLKADTRRGRRFLLQEGRIRGGKVYPLHTTAGAEGIPANDLTIVDVQSEWVSQAALLLADAWDRFEREVPPTGQTVVYAVRHTGDATLAAPEGAWAPGTTIVVDSWDVPAGQTSAEAGGAHAPASPAVNLIYGIGGMYRFTPGEDLAAPATLTLRYRDEHVAGFSEADLQIYRTDDALAGWELIGGTVDTGANAVTASVAELGLFALAPPLPAGELAFQLSDLVLPADGSSTMSAEAGSLLLNNGTPAGDGWAYTVRATGMEIVTADRDPAIDGVQVVSTGGAVAVEFRAPARGGVGTFAVRSVHGDARGEGMIAFEDTTTPSAVTGLAVQPGQSRLFVSWDAADLAEHVAGYKVYYSEGHELPPFNGQARVEGEPSPVAVTGNGAMLRGLNPGSQYYVAVSAVDSSGNEGPLSNVVTATTVESPPAPPLNVHSEPDGTDQHVVSWTLSEDDGFNDRDVDYYEVYRRIVGSGSIVKAAAVPAGRSIYTDVIDALPDGATVLYDLITVDTAGLSSEPSPGMPMAVAWRSVRTHGGSAGDLAIELDPKGFTVEPRAGGLQRIEVVFDYPVQLVPDVVIEAVDSAAAITYPASSVNLADDDTTLEIHFDPGVLPDQATYLVDLSDAVQGRAGQVLAGDTDCTIGSLIGDVNGGGLVDNRDVIAVRVRRGQSVTAGDSRHDVNCDGIIDNSDLTAIRARRGNGI